MMSWKMMKMMTMRIRMSKWILLYGFLGCDYFHYLFQRVYSDGLHEKLNQILYGATAWGLYHFLAKHEAWCSSGNPKLFSDARCCGWDRYYS